MRLLSIFEFEKYKWGFRPKLLVAGVQLYNHHFVSVCPSFRLSRAISRSRKGLESWNLVQVLFKWLSRGVFQDFSTPLRIRLPPYGICNSTFEIIAKTIRCGFGFRILVFRWGFVFWSWGTSRLPIDSSCYFDMVISRDIEVLRPSF